MTGTKKQPAIPVRDSAVHADINSEPPDINNRHRCTITMQASKNRHFAHCA